MPAPSDNPSAAPALPREPDAPPDLIFEWKRRRANWLRLLGFLCLAFAGHAVFFYLFKVVTPASRRPVPPENHITLLRASDPDAAALLRTLEDRSPGGLLAGENSPLQDLRDLHRAVPPYLASFAGHQATLHEPELFPQPPLPLLLSPSDPILPKLPPGESPASPVLPKNPDIPFSIHVLLSDALAARGFQSPPVWPAELSAPDESTESFLFQIAVDSSGVVRYCLVDGVAPPESLRRALQQARFHPAESPGLTWGTAEVHW